MDEQVLIYWDAVAMDPNNDDLAGYRVYISDNNEDFTLVNTVGPAVTEDTVRNLINGRTYFFAVASFDETGNESELSRENVFDTPRPEGFDQQLFSYLDPFHSYQSGFDFSNQVTLRWDSPSCDFFVEFDTSSNVQAFFLWLGRNGLKIQDMGYTDGFDEITYAPDDGWSQFDYVEAIQGHTYVIETVDFHYAKVRVTSLIYNPFSIVVDWGYQVAQGNRELKIDPRSVVNMQNGSEVQ
jgi:hypothetical protein